MPPVNPRTAPIVRHTQEPAAKARKRVRIVRGAPEDDLQASIFDLWTLRKAQDTRCFHVPNGGRRAWKTARAMKRLGTMPGIPDLIFINVFGLAFFMEVKAPSLPGSRAKRGRLSDDQAKFRDWCQSNSIPWVEVNSLESAEAWMVERRLINPATRANS